MVRETVVDYARTMVNNDHDIDGYPNPPLKFIILDEADFITFDAQAALRRVMEEHMDDTRFILCCNYYNRIIAPVQSRCALIPFNQLQDADHAKRIATIA